MPDASPCPTGCGSRTPATSTGVHLPFLQVALGDVAVLPLTVGHVDPEQVAAVLEAVWGGEETLIVVSTDLSHYHDHDTAIGLDRRTADAVVRKRPDLLGRYDACGVVPLQGLLLAAVAHRARCRVARPPDLGRHSR